MFLVTGIINNKECTLEYNNGILTGDTIALEKAKIENTKDHGYIGVLPSVTNKDYLQHYPEFGIMLSVRYMMTMNRNDLKCFLMLVIKIQ